jgi:hypothetical protein
MKQRVLLTALLLSAFLTRAQTILLVAPPRQACVGQRLEVEFQHRQADMLGPDNVFHLEVSTDAYQIEWQALPTQRVGDRLLAELPARLAAFGRIYYRISTSQPVGSSYAEPLFVHTAPTALLEPPLSDPRFTSFKNPGTESQVIRLTLTGGGPYRLLFSDSTEAVVPDYVTPDAKPVTTSYGHRFIPQGTGSFRLLRVENSCLAGRVTGEAALPLNDLGFVLTHVPTDPVCAGGTYTVHFSANGTLPATTRFEALLFRPGTRDLVRTLNVTFDGNRLAFVVPADVPAGEYGLALRSESPRLFVVVRDQIPAFQIHPPAEVRLTGELSVPRGEQATLTARVTGAGFVTALLSDSSYVTFEPSTGSEQKVSFRPLTSGPYRMLSAQSGCGPVQFSGEVRATVFDNLTLDSLSASTVCLGTTIRMYVRGSRPLVPGQQLTWRLGLPDPALQEVVTTVRAVDARTLEGTVPLPILAGLYRMRFEDGGSLRSSYSNYVLRVLRRPEVDFTSLNDTYADAGRASVAFRLSGGPGWYEITLSDGSAYHLLNAAGATGSYFTSAPFFPKSAQATYTIRSVRNQCGEGNALGSIWTVRVQKPEEPTLQMRLVDERNCPNQPLRVAYASTGIPDTTATFRLELSDASGRWNGNYLAQSNQPRGELSGAWPTAPGTYSLRMVSSTGLATNPFSMLRPAPNPMRVVSVSHHAVSVDTFAVLLPGSNRSLGLEVQGYRGVPPTRLRFSNGYETLLSDGLSGAFSIPVPYQNTTYRLVSAVDACGQSLPVVSMPRLLFVQPVQMHLSNNPSQVSLCGEETRTLNAFVEGRLPAGKRLVVQVQARPEGPFVTVPTQGTQPLRVTMPTFSPFRTDARLRLVAVGSGDTLYPMQQLAPLFFAQQRPPTSTLTSATGGEIRADSGQVVSLRIRSDLSSLGYPSTAFRSFLTSGQVDDVTQADQPVSVRVQRSTTYRLSAVLNACGFGPVQGQVAVQLAAQIERAQVATTAVCVGQKWRLSYRALGQFAADNRFRVWLVSGNTRLEAGAFPALSGDVDLTAAAAQAGEWNVVVASTNPVRERSAGRISIEPSASLRLVTSEQSIYAGEKALLYLAGTGGGTVSATLSNGQTLLTHPQRSQPIEVQPTQTTTYRLTTATNACGTVPVSGEALVRVLPAGERRLTSRTAAVLCRGLPFVVRASSTGTFDASNQFTIELSDSTGTRFEALTTAPANRGVPDELVATLPESTPLGPGYRIRVTASQPATVGTSVPFPIRVQAQPTARLSWPGPVAGLDSVRLRIDWTGTPPFNYRIVQSPGPVLMGYALVSPGWLSVKSVGTGTQTYTLQTAQDRHCPARLEAPTTVSVELVTATDHFPTDWQLRVFPNPGARLFRLTGHVPQPGEIRAYLHDATGRTVWTRSWLSEGSVTQEIDGEKWPTGVYLLTLEHGSQRMVWRLVKL